MENYPWRETSCTNLLLHFMHRHVEDTTMLLNKGSVPHPQYRQCDMSKPLGVMAAGHLGTAMYKIGVE